MENNVAYWFRHNQDPYSQEMYDGLRKSSKHINWNGLADYWYAEIGGRSSDTRELSKQIRSDIEFSNSWEWSNYGIEQEVGVSGISEHNGSECKDV